MPTERQSRGSPPNRRADIVQRAVQRHAGLLPVVHEAPEHQNVAIRDFVERIRRIRGEVDDPIGVEPAPSSRPTARGAPSSPREPAPGVSAHRRIRRVVAADTNEGESDSIVVDDDDGATAARSSSASFGDIAAILNGRLARLLAATHMDT